MTPYVCVMLNDTDTEIPIAGLKVGNRVINKDEKSGNWFTYFYGICICNFATFSQKFGIY